MAEVVLESEWRVAWWRPGLVVGRSGRGTVRGGEGNELADTGPVTPLENTRKL